MKSDSDSVNHHSCFEVASRYLSYRPYSEAELKARLQHRGFETQSIEKAISRLKEQGFVDDFAFARYWKENRERFSPRSRALLRQELRQKGVDAEVTAEVIDEMDDKACAYRAAQKKAKASTPSDYSDFRRKLFAFLQRRGFSYEMCQHTVDQVWREKNSPDPSTPETNL